MTKDIFKIFEKSIEQVEVKDTDRGSISKTSTIDVSLDAIVKRRKLMTNAVSDSEDYKNNTTIKFRVSDSEYIKVGYYVNIDNEWHSIVEVRDGKNFDTGDTEFIYAVIGNDILLGDDPVWTGSSS